MNKLLFLLACIYCILLTGCASKEAKPLIGISCSYPDSMFSSVRKTYSESIIKAGGIPLLIPVTVKEDVLTEIISRMDGLILIGGEDICPSYYKEEAIPELGRVNGIRDVYDLLLIRLASERKLPTLGICRGLQAVNVAFGGSLYQDIPSQYPDTTVNHNQKEPSSITTHLIKLQPGSIIATITEKEELITNTHHHQAIKDIAPGFKATAWSTDGIIEAIESTIELPIWAVQFHPEGQAINDDPVMLSFFKFLIKQASSK
ncbi:gamma-glutamyl-gamma-aminobutyrate hydrolase family protein [Bacteroides sp. 224]|uniref:gamma-glutamyl-gamma-aminobutyrate hydrolase family protein n=1 Tax=Bacteroides sp. 224 TaxID=2302936 RepID=UPI0013D2A982|nr:gamma-glutamyl-gamma-aminobutyrate hydrolase family protein [Bacteroides sp. 224]NDV66947.1 gamma-glutamyl-gamma-aminobutyrate hydrolase family protein [Bacteroides sp. 224]